MRVIVACILLTCFCWAQSAKRGHRQDRSRGIPQENDLALKAEIVKQSYCHADEETFSVKMEIRLLFTNISNHPVILAKLIESPFTVRAAKTISDAEMGDFEYDPNIDYFPSKLPPAPRFGDNPAEKYFVILAPKQSYQTTVISGVFGATNSALVRKGSGFLAKGQHVLQVGVGAWPYQWPYFGNSITADQLSARWSKYGHLAYGVVYSDIVPFTIPDSFENPPCGSAQQSGPKRKGRPGA